jgi:exonuclease III
VTEAMKFATFNANSIRARLELVLDWLRREAPDILCVQETKVQDVDFPTRPFRDAGYRFVFRGPMQAWPSSVAMSPGKWPWVLTKVTDQMNRAWSGR